MMRPISRVASAAVLLLAAASTVLSQAPDRSRPPAPGPPPALKLPPIQKFELGNSIPVFFIETHKVPLVQVAVVLRSGVPADPKGKPGLANLTAEMLDRGAGGRSALELSDAVDHLGAELGASADWDEITVGLSVPSERLEPALAILSDAVRKPTFPAEELERVRRELLTTFLQWRDEPESIARVAFARAVFGDHPYGRITEGTEAFVRAASREDLERFHRAAFVPANAAIVAAGDVTAANLKTLLEGAFGSWTGTGERAPAVAHAPQVRGRSIWIVDVPDAAQSEIRIGRVGAARSTPDFFPILIANTILGGSFSSRLNQNLRERHGYAYGAGSAFDFRLSTGPFFASGAVQTDKTAPALAEFFKELEGMRRPASEEELSRARNYLALRYPRGFETTALLVGRLEAKVVYDLPDDYFTTYMDRIAKVSAEDVSRVAAKYLDPSSAVVIVVGDRKKIEPAIRALNLAPVRVFTVDQILGKAAAVGPGGKSK
jgi:predicted Zn-dependent peptidase